MLPILIAVGPFKVYTYALFFVLAACLFGFVIWKRGRESHFDESELFDATFLVLLWGILISRLTYIGLYKFAEFGINLWGWLNLLGKPGLASLGFFWGSGIAAYYQAKKRKWDMLSFSDTLLTAYVLFQAVMALGAFLNGNGYGIVANNIFGLRFLGLVDKHVPVQLYEFIIYAMIFWFLIWVEGKYRTFSWYRGTKSEASSGFITAMYFILIGIAGLGLTIVKTPQLVWWGIRLDYLIELGYLIFGASLLYRRSAASVAKSYSSWTSKQQAVKINGYFESGGGDKKPQTNNASRWTRDIFD